MRGDRTCQLENNVLRPGMKSVIKKQSRQEGMMKERGIGHKFLQRGIKSYGKATSASSSLKRRK